MRSDEAVFARAESAFDAGAYRRAARLWAGIPDDPDAWFNAANAYAAAGDVERAKPLYGRAIDGGVIEAYLNRAILFEAAGDRAAALELLRRGAEAGDRGARVSYGTRLAEDGLPHAHQYLDAEADLETPFGRSATLGLARLLLREGDDPSRAVDLLRGLGEDVDARLELADAYLTVGRVGKAERVLRRLLEQGVTGAALPLGNLLRDHRADERAAARAFKTGLSMGDAYSAFNLGVLRFRQGKRKSAVRHIRCAADRDDEMAAAWLTEHGYSTHRCNAALRKRSE